MSKRYRWRALCPTCGRLVFGCKDGGLRAHRYQNSNGAPCPDRSPIPNDRRRPVDKAGG